ncbi:PepSY domain-containing protein [Arenibacter troitsensis]|uniref:PepSY-associated TM region n=1 Tax=Arenibacter troitsensis TaxID=188872 RepID=A0A1X7L5F3_9FLAO|nr:PepSY domain-containing protein [Arenibacter troitsensis]SMG48613.1 PepSY-associated TM region [Arenibacter troitsensis]
MAKRKTAILIRKAHRYLGIFLGIQFLMWTISGTYFSWTDIDDIHGDQFRLEHVRKTAYSNLISPSAIEPEEKITSIALREIAGEPYYWINDQKLVHAQTGRLKNEIMESDALQIAERYMLKELKVTGIERLEQVGKYSEYRNGRLPAYVISYETPNNLMAYVSARDGAFQTVRHRDWRWFDFLWMTHTMDYEGRDDFNTIILRIFSILGLVTVFSGFLLWYISSPTIRKIKKRENY